MFVQNPKAAILAPAVLRETQRAHDQAAAQLLAAARSHLLAAVAIDRRLARKESRPCRRR